VLAALLAADASTIRRTAHDILSRPEFRPPPESPLTSLRRWAFNQLGRLLEAVVGGSALGLVGLVCAVVTVAGLGWLVWHLRGTSARASRRTGVIIEGAPRRVEDWLAEAATCEASGDWRGALRCRYRALVAELARRGLVEELPGRTTGDYRRAIVSAAPAAAADFAAATELFEFAWYADRPTDVTQAGRLRDIAEHVLEETR
jgi:hypothetical protein